MRAVSIAAIALVASAILVVLVSASPRTALPLLLVGGFLLFGAAGALGVLLGRALDRSRAADERARETEQLTSALLASLAHDLRTPLASLIGAATALQALGDRLTPEKRASLAETIVAEARRLNRHLENLLDMKRLEHGAVRPVIECTDLRDAALAARSHIDALPQRRVRQSIPEDAAFVLADAGLLEQILVNILDNAAKFGDPDGVIRIEAGAHGDAVALSVSDDGPGVGPEERKRIFEPFHTAARSGRGRAGTGLGLAIAHGFARAMGADVRLRDGAAGRGACFEIILPRAERASADKSAQLRRGVDDDAA
jgi:two-component system sensor histidine kinase KdpD